MSKRMSLVESLKRDLEEPIDPAVEKTFLKYGTVTPPRQAVETIETEEPEIEEAPPTSEPKPVKRSAPSPRRAPRPSKVTPIGLIPVTVRLRPEIAGALKRASLERQLAGEELYTQQDIVEQALEPWLKEQGYL